MDEFENENDSDDPDYDCDYEFECDCLEDGVLGEWQWDKFDRTWKCVSCWRVQ